MLGVLERSTLGGLVVFIDGLTLGLFESSALGALEGGGDDNTDG